MQVCLHGTTIVAAITSTSKIYPVTVPLTRKEGGLKQPSVVNLAQILTIDRSRLRRRVGTLSPELVERVNAASKSALMWDSLTRFLGAKLAEPLPPFSTQFAETST